MDAEQYVSRAVPPVVWSSPVKYYPAKPGFAAAGAMQERPVPDVGTAATINSGKFMDAQSSKALLVLQERLAQATAGSRHQLAQAAAAFQQQLADVQAASAATQEALQERLVQQCRRRQQQLLLGSCLLAWRCQQQAQQRQTQQRRMLALIVQAWHESVQCIRSERHEQQSAVLHCWHMHAQQQAAAARRINILQQRHLLRVLLAWLRLSTAQQATAQQYMAWAQHWHSRRVMHRCYGSWKQQWSSKQQLVQEHREQQQLVLVHRLLQEWQWLVQQTQMEQQHEHATAAQNHSRLQRTWTSWRKLMGSGLQLAVRHHRQQMLQASFGTWLQLPAANLRLRAISAAVGSVYQQLLQDWGYRAFCSCCSEAVAVRRAARQYLRAWCSAAAASVKQRRWARVRAARRRRMLLEGCVRGWVCVTWQAFRWTAAVQASELQAALTACEADHGCSQDQLEVLLAHQQRLVELVRAASRAAAPELPLAPTLHWQCLAAGPGQDAQPQQQQQVQLQPRARHAAFALPALQPAQQHMDALQHYLQTACTSLNQYPCELAGCLVMFGGVGHGGGWLTDVSLLLLTDNSGGTADGCCVQSTLVPSLAPCQQGDNREGAGSSRIGSLPVPVCDFAACECGQAAFVVVGGFDGQSASMQLQQCTLVYVGSTEQQAADTAQSEGSGRRSCSSKDQPSTTATTAAIAAGAVQDCEGQQKQQEQLTAEAWSRRWRCSWQILQPRTRSPVGRSHHSVCWHAASRSLIVFGGYANRQGCMDDVQVYNMDHREWWQPEQTGPWPCSRRSHAAVILGDSLWVHGGLDGSGQHLQDLWRLDLTSWQWQQLGGKAGGLVSSCVPAPRRAHCLVGVQGRFLLLHGGYSGTCDLLQDAWLYDTHRDCWMPVELTATAAAQPVARALHTVTYLAQRFVVVGGQTSLGPLGQVGTMCSPAVLHAQQLQQQAIQHQLQLEQMQREQLELQAQCAGYEAQLESDHVANKALAQEATAAEQSAANSFYETTKAVRAMQAAAAAAAEAEDRAHAAANMVATLERRLERAREGGRQALAAAAAVTAQLHHSGQC